MSATHPGGCCAKVHRPSIREWTRLVPTHSWSPKLEFHILLCVTKHYSLLPSSPLCINMRIILSFRTVQNRKSASGACACREGPTVTIIALASSRPLVWWPNASPTGREPRALVTGRSGVPGPARGRCPHSLEVSRQSSVLLLRVRTELFTGCIRESSSSAYPASPASRLPWATDTGFEEAPRATHTMPLKAAVAASRGAWRWWP